MEVPPIIFEIWKHVIIIMRIIKYKNKNGWNLKVCHRPNFKLWKDPSNGTKKQENMAHTSRETWSFSSKRNEALALL